MNSENKNMVYRQLEEFTIESDQKLHCSLDGEPIAKKTQLQRASAATAGGVLADSLPIGARH